MSLVFLSDGGVDSSACGKKPRRLGRPSESFYTHLSPHSDPAKKSCYSRPSVSSPEAATSVKGAKTSLLNLGTNKRPVLGPGPVVVRHPLRAEQLMKNEPGVGGPFPNPAVGNHFVVAQHTGSAVEVSQLGSGPE